MCQPAVVAHAVIEALGLGTLHQIKQHVQQQRRQQQHGHQANQWKMLSGERNAQQDRTSGGGFQQGTEEQKPLVVRVQRGSHIFEMQYDASAGTWTTSALADNSHDEAPQLLTASPVAVASAPVIASFEASNSCDGPNLEVGLEQPLVDHQSDVGGHTVGPITIHGANWKRDHATGEALFSLSARHMGR